MKEGKKVHFNNLEKIESCLRPGGYEPSGSIMPVSELEKIKFILKLCLEIAHYFSSNLILIK